MSAPQSPREQQARLDLPVGDGPEEGSPLLRLVLPATLLPALDGPPARTLAVAGAGLHVLVRRYTREGDSLVRLAVADGRGAGVTTRLPRLPGGFDAAVGHLEDQLRERPENGGPARHALLLLPDGEDLPDELGLDGDGDLTVGLRLGPVPELFAEVDPGRISRAAAARLLEHLGNLLVDGIARPRVSVEELRLMSGAERRRVVEEWAGGPGDPPRSGSVPDLFRERVLATPDAPAVDDGRTHSYRDLDARSGRIAASLAARGIGPGAVVGIALERGVDQIAALLGVLRAGAAYLPLDPAYPDARLGLMLRDTAAPMVLVDGATSERFGAFGGEAARVPVAELLGGDAPGADPASPGPADAAYVIYTSGSTGRPKGVRALHRGIVRLVRGQHFAETGPGRRVMAFAPVSFDAATFEIWAPLLNGGTVVVAPPGPLGPAELGRFIQEARVDTCWLTAALFHQMVAGGVDRLRPLRQLLTGGDVVSPEHARRVLEAVPGLTLVNGYGPTENTTFTTCHVMRGPDDVGRTVSIGRPIASTTVRVLDPTGRPVPVGVPGELHAGGAGVADGYVGLPDATAERFVPDPLRSGERLYRTGDLVRWRDDGTLDFLGRVDTQVKIAGFRIEPGEVEGRLLALSGVREVAVRARGDHGRRRLIAWLVPETGGDLPGDDALRAHCAEALPGYMVPASFVRLEALPTTPNGKLDEAALPLPAPEQVPTAALSSAVDDAGLQRAVSELWCAVLEVGEVDPDAGFFEVGGTSLLGMRLLDEVQERFGTAMPVATFYRHPTVRSMARWLAGPPAEQGVARPAARPPSAAPRSGDRRIAVVGMAARVPGAPDVEALWRMLDAGRDGHVDYGDGDLRAAGVPEERIAHPDYVRAGYPLGDAFGFDAAFFGMLPREVELMDPQQRLFLELAWTAVESAGYDPREVPGRVGVFGGVGRNAYLVNNLATRPELADVLGEHVGLVGNLNDFPTTHVSFRLGLEGPSVNVQTACSTSGVAVHLASRSLLDGECDMALAGGCKVLVPHDVGYMYTEGGALSAGGRIRAFDAGADGMVRGSGGAMLVLKRLADALADGDEILGVLLGSATNNDGGQRAGFAAPSPEGQARVISAALEAAGVSADSIDYVEAHGTGTLLGDPIEVEGLTAAFRRHTDRRGFCGLGSIKSSIGHLDAGATVAGIVKVLLSFRHGRIPATANFRSPNPHIDFDATPFRVVDEARPWPRSSRPRRAGVSSFGLGGSNAHLVFEEPPPARGRVSGNAPAPVLLVASARTAAALERTTASLADHLETRTDLDLADVAWTLQSGRHRFGHRRALAVTGRDDAVRLLRTPSDPRVATREEGAADAAPVFLFPGQGTQHPGMGLGLYRREPVYRAVVDRCAERLLPLLGVDLREAVGGVGDSGAAERLRATGLAQPALYVHQVAMAELLSSRGIHPAAVAGHSIGEYAAAVVAGVLDRDDGLRLVAARGRLMQAQPGGAMVAVALAEADLAPLLPPGVSLAAVNGPASCVASGPHEAVADLVEALTEQGHEPRVLRTSHAFHSAMMDPVVDAFADEVRRIALRPPSVPFASTVTGALVGADTLRDPSYWTRQVRVPVRFAEAVRALADAGHGVFVDVGPGCTAATLARGVVGTGLRSGVVAASRHPAREVDDAVQLLDAVGRLWLHGARPDGRAPGGDDRRRVSLPTYPFERTTYRIEPLRAAPLRMAAPHAPHPAQTPLEEAPVAALQPPDRIPVLIDQLRSLLFELSGLEPASLAADATFLELGFDSLFLAQVGGAVRKRFGVKVGVRTLLDGAPTLDALARHLDEVLPADAVPAPAPPSGRPAAPGAAAPAAPVAPGPAAPLPPGGLEGLAGVIQQQLHLMQHQLALITGGAGGTPVADGAAGAAGSPAPATTTPRPSVPAAAGASPSGGGDPSPIPGASGGSERPHGPWRPLQRTGSALDDTRRAAIDDLVSRVNALTAGSKAFMAEHRATLADPRSVVGFRSEWKDLVYQIVVDSACGGRVRDVDGNSFVDVVGAFGANFLGHSPPYVTEAVRRELDAGFAVGPQTALAGDVARLVSELTGMERVALCNTGSEAVLAALRICRTVRGRDRVACFSGHYHGIFDEVLVKGVDVAGRRRNFPVAPGIPQHAVDPMLVLDYGEATALDEIRRHADELACVILEPVRSRNPALQPVAFVRELRELTLELGIPLVFDEMVTGFRVHPGGAQAAFGVRADLATYGKVAGGGHPIGIVAGGRELMDALDGGAWHFGDDSVPEADMTWFAGTFVRHPVAMAAARAALGHIRDAGPGLQEGLNARTASWVAEMNDWFETRDVPVHFEAYSSFFLPTYTCHQEYADLLPHYLLTRGVFAREQRPLFWSVAHTDEDWEAVTRAYRESTLEMQAAGLLTDREGGAVTPGPQHAPYRVEERPVTVPLTEPQREVWTATRFGDGASASFNLALRFSVDGALDRDAMRTALQHLVDRHEALRATFDEEGEVQTLHPRVTLEVPCEPVPGEDPSAVEAAAAALERDEVRRPFDLERGPLVRARILELAPQRWRVLLTVHHIVADGWACGILARELGALYAAEVAGEAPQLGPVMQLREYVRHLESDDERESRAEAEAFWRRELDPLPEPLELPTDRPRPPEPTFEADHLRMQVEPAQVRRIKEAASRAGATFFAYALAAFDAYLHRITGQEDVVVGFDLAGQALVPGRDLVCHAVNFLPLRVAVEPALPFDDLVSRVRRTLFGVIENQRMTYGGLLRLMRVAPDPGRRPLISVSFNLDPGALEADFGPLDVTVDSLPRGYETNDVFLNLVQRAGDRLEIQCTYDTALFDRDTMRRRLEGYLALLGAAVDAPSTPVGRLPVLGADEADLVSAWNRTGVYLGEETTLHGLVRAQAARTPDAPAVSAPEAGVADEMTYGELDWRSDSLAARLRELGVGRESRVAVSMERSAELVVALLAVLKAGGAYVPVAPEYPRARKAYMLADCGAHLVLTQRALVDGLPDDVEPVVVDELWVDLAPGEVPASGVGPGDLAYVIYTSGSTGRPKGAMIEHRAVVNRLRWMQDLMGLGASDVVLQKTPASFDVSVWEFFWPLATGAVLRMAEPGRQGDAEYLARTVDEARVTTMHFVPSMLVAFLDRPETGSLASLRRVVCSGEALSPALRDRFFASVPDVELWNLYGPTEAAVDVSAHRCRPGDPAWTVPIGGPVANTTLHVLDDAMAQVPVGVPGELWIGGIQVGRGYLDRDGLTQQRFVADPFAPGGRLYRTGDRVRWRADGEIEFLGRLDHQVKVRGFRIELGEIEASLQKVPGIREAVVTAPELRAGDRVLVAYLTGESATDVDGVRRRLAAVLPDYMVPTRWVALDELLLTPSGKVDRARLPEPDGPVRSPSAGGAPETETERAVAAVWSEILGVDAVGLDDDFFGLGGHSILAARVVARIRSGMGVEVPLRTLFATSRLGDFADEVALRRLATTTGAEADEAPPSDETEEVVL